MFLVVSAARLVKGRPAWMMAGMPAAQRPQPWYSAIRALIGLGALATAMGFAGAWGWLFDLASHFRLQYALGLSLCAAAALVARRRRAALVAALAAAVNGALVVPVWLAPDAPSPGRARLTLLVANIQLGNPDPARLLTLIEGARPDVVGLLELGPDWAARLDAALVDYPHRHVLPRDDRFGIAVYSRRPVRLGPVGPGHTPVLWASVPMGDTALRLALVHVHPPMSPQLGRWRDEQLMAIGREAGAHPGPTAVCGDLNATPWSSIFPRLLDAGRLVDSRRGFGLHATWPSPLVPFGIPIDHCLVSPELVVVDRRVGPAFGSDHRPLLVTLALPDAPP